ncbi:hypothetical protein GOP47_0007240 [Adiantum capillus-veneris]|uniref:Glutamate receptor n=1 Tax=Adiantum capillus-veneris TaxID=13818 RepID=A0A9D4V0A8_ADICA|nr:hypothetical protein GOP47_0007240 [Adiantum capillus-veneris]
MNCMGSSNLPGHAKIGALFAFNSTVGKLVQQAIQLAVRDVNTAMDVLNGTKLEMEMFDSGCNPVQGAASAVELVKRSVLAIVGPQSSAVAQFVAHIGSATNVPLVSFGATDPNLSEMQYPFFIRVVPSDRLQMEAVAAFIANYGWKEAVVFHMDDDYGMHGASSLSNSLQARGSKVIDKVALIPGIDKDGIDTQLIRLAERQTRVFVLHTPPDVGRLILQEAYFHDMLESNYAWIVTDLMSNSLTDSELDTNTVKYTQGLIGVRRFVPQTSELGIFMSEWNNSSQSGLLENQINPYALYAYDAVWAIARALDSYLHDRQAVVFQEPIKLPTQSGGEADLSQLKIFQGGNKLRAHILDTKFKGTSGHIKFDNTGDLEGAAFEFVNMVGKSPHAVGYWWTNGVGVSLTPPIDQAFSSSNAAYNDEAFLSSTQANSTKMPIIWPGKVTDAPRGWVLPKNGHRLKIGVPLKAGYTQIVGVSNDTTTNSTSVHGFCISVFQAALNYLPYAVPYDFVLVGDGVTTPTYNDLVSSLAEQKYDAIVGDVSILAERLKIVDFTQPYIESGLVVLVPVKDKKENNPWAFLRPFTSVMWFTVLVSFLFTGTVIWILEHKVNEEFRGPPKAQFITVLTFIFSTLFFSQKEETRSFFGRIVLLIWLFVILIINSSYTASLTSILTVEQLAPSIKGLESLLQTSFPIGYQTGSFVYDYLRNLNVNPLRLKAYNSREDSIKALTDGPSRGGVAAIVEELPYIQLLQSVNCKKFIIAGQEFTKSGWGFAFPRGSDITSDMSQAILHMSETGELERIRTYWFQELACDDSSKDPTVQSNQLDIMSFWGLFLISGVASIICVLIHLLSLYNNYRKHQQAEGSTITVSKRFSEHFKQFIVYADKAKHEEKKVADGKGADISLTPSMTTKV